MIFTFYHDAFEGHLSKLLSIAWREGTDSEGIGGIPDFTKLGTITSRECRPEDTELR
jgi:hypothetical protein